jgi:hypothetical protein
LPAVEERQEFPAGLRQIESLEFYRQGSHQQGLVVLVLLGLSQFVVPVSLLVQELMEEQMRLGQILCYSLLSSGKDFHRGEVGNRRVRH